jgi:HSP20 family protein
MPDKNLPEKQTETSFFPSLQKEMNRLFDQFRTGFPTSENGLPATFGTAAYPAIDVIDTDESVKISAEVPGVEEDDLDVSITGDTLVLKGKKSAAHEEKADNYHRIERQYGSFRRQIPLGFTPESGAVDVNFKDGVLNLQIKKPANAKAEVQKINIKKT